jgi:hypothetical protein
MAAGKKNDYLANLLSVLHDYGVNMHGEGALLVKAIRELLGKGLSVSSAVDAALKQRNYNEFVAKTITDSVYKMALVGYGIPLTIRVDAGAQKNIAKKLTNTPWSGDGMKLSARLHGNKETMRMAIISTIQTSINRQDTLNKLSMELYDGYKSGKRVIEPAELPKYLNQLHQAAKRVAAGRTPMKEFDKALAIASANMDKIIKRNKAGTPNTNMMITYKNLVKEAEAIVKATGKLNTEALDRAAWAAVQEKSRYHADRIARTEDARAWFDGFILETQDDDLVWGYRWVLSNRHKYVPFDQCDVCANMDIGYGKGVYPKDKVPSIPRHPHCMCSLEIVYFDEIDTSARFNPDGARKYIDSLTEHQREALFGIDGAKAYKQGTDWQKLLRGWGGFENPVSRLSPSDIGVFKEKEIASEVKSCYNKIIEKEPPITKDIQRIIEDSGGKMEGLDFRIKTRESFLRKVDADSQTIKAAGSDITLAQIAAAMSDVIRYTGIADADNLYDFYSKAMGQIENTEYKIIKVKNTWGDIANPYRGVNTVIQSPDGQNFELQFHTPESFKLKQNELHELYEEYRLVTTSATRKRELLKKMFALSAALIEPKDIDKIKNRGER